MTIDEIKQRLRAKFANDYQLVRKVIRRWTNDKLLYELGFIEKRQRDLLLELTQPVVLEYPCGTIMVTTVGVIGACGRMLTTLLIYQLIAGQFRTN